MAKSTYILPEEVTSPRRNWTITRILVPGGPEDLAIALGKWNGEDGIGLDVIGLRWNGTADNPIGNPQSRGLSTWFILEAGHYTDAIIEALPPAERTLVRQFIPKGKI